MLAPWNMFKHSSKKIFTHRSKAVLLLWILFVIYVSRLSLLYRLVCSLQPCDHLLTSWLSCVWCFLELLSLSHYGVSGQVWYFIVSIPDLCLRYFYMYQVAKMNSNDKTFRMPAVMSIPWCADSEVVYWRSGPPPRQSQLCRFPWNFTGMDPGKITMLPS